MGNKRISQLDELTALSLDDLLVAVDMDGPATRRITVANALRQVPRFLKVSLTYSTPDGALAEAVPAGALVLRRIVVVTEAWDTAATLQVGTATDPDRYVRSGDVDLQTAGTYTVDETTYEGAEEDVYVDFDHAGATQGAAVLLLEIVR